MIECTHEKAQSPYADGGMQWCPECGATRHYRLVWGVNGDEDDGEYQYGEWQKPTGIWRQVAGTGDKK